MHDTVDRVTNVYKYILFLKYVNYMIIRSRDQRAELKKYNLILAFSLTLQAFYYITKIANRQLCTTYMFGESCHVIMFMHNMCLFDVE
jgi:hypothetical protein